MNQLLEWLSGGDLRSDGLSDEVADIVLKNPQLFEDLFSGLTVPDDVIRGRTADALEKISRVRPDMLVDHLPELIQVAKSDTVPMVKMHLAMMLGHLAIYEEKIDVITSPLLDMLEDESVFAKSWAIVSLCIIARNSPQMRSQIVDSIASLDRDKSIAIRTRVRKAINLLVNEGTPFPAGWIKSKHVAKLLS